MVKENEKGKEIVKVKELIEKLKACDQEAEVTIGYETYKQASAKSVEVCVSGSVCITDEEEDLGNT